MNIVYENDMTLSKFLFFYVSSVKAQADTLPRYKNQVNISLAMFITKELCD